MLNNLKFDQGIFVSNEQSQLSEYLFRVNRDYQSFSEKKKTITKR